MKPALTQIRDALEMVRDADIDRKLDGLPMMPHPARVSIVRALERVAEVEQAEGKVLEQLTDVNRRIDAAAKQLAEKDAEIARLRGAAQAVLDNVLISEGSRSPLAMRGVWMKGRADHAALFLALAAALGKGVVEPQPEGAATTSG